MRNGLLKYRRVFFLLVCVIMLSAAAAV
ncbi:hypothetical protein A2U01_0085993, partial [Trifolium medium]|nr:hypothetical protein [Trifolium medium]